MDTKLIQVWTVQVQGQPVRVATVEHGRRVPSLCTGCPAPCCQGILHPVLTADEFHQRKFPTVFLLPPDWLKERTSRAQAIATLAMTGAGGGCTFFDHETHLCTAWPDCPKGCLAYDCRLDTRDEIREFAQQRVKEVGSGRDGGNGP